jgi:hypothetical protein
MESNLHSNGSDSVPDYSSFSDGSIMLNPAFKIGQFVYVKTDPDQVKRIVTGYEIRGKTIVYLVSYMQHEFKFYDYELTNYKDDNIKLGIS